MRKRRDAGRRGAGRRGEDLGLELTLTLEEIARGTEKKVRIKRQVTCPECSGNGSGPSGHSGRCSQCDGTGEIKVVQRALWGQVVQTVPCTRCGGEGTVIDDPCPGCRGEGRVEGREEVLVKIPAGVSEGQRLVKRADGSGMAPAIEILVNSPNVRQILLEGGTRDLGKVMANDTYYKMQTFNQALLAMVKAGTITEEEALATSSTPDDLKLGFRGVVRRASAKDMAADFGFQKGGAAGGIQRGFGL